MEFDKTVTGTVLIPDQSGPQMNPVPAMHLLLLQIRVQNNKGCEEMKSISFGDLLFDKGGDKLR